MVGNCCKGNCCKGFIFAFFTSQEPFTKIKTAKILSFMCKANKPSFNPRPILGTMYIAANRSMSVSAPLTAITEAISRKSKCYVSTDTRTRRGAKP